MQKSGSGFHVNISLIKDRKNIFSDLSHQDSIASHFMAGVLDKTNDMTAILNPLVNSYARLGSHEAPKNISWSYQNCSKLIRIPAINLSSLAQMELRSPDPAVNPYLVLTLLIYAGIEGIHNQLTLPDPIVVNTKMKRGTATRFCIVTANIGNGTGLFRKQRIFTKVSVLFQDRTIFDCQASRMRKSQEPD